MELYVKASLSVLAAIIATELLALWWIPPWHRFKATGIDFIVGCLRESRHYARLWVIALALFADLFAISRLNSPALRVAFFWFPTISILSLGIFVGSGIMFLLHHALRVTPNTKPSNGRPTQ